ncbi:metallopeptidase TldD-related protein, partial [Candidatus Hydrogenedentota bacterium]
VVFDSSVASEFLDIAAASVKADHVLKNKSLFAGMLGEQVAADCVQVVDDGRLERGIYATPFDGEGIPTRDTSIIEDGILKSYLHSVYTAGKMKAGVTGNGMRGSYSGLPEVGTTNLYLKNGDKTPEDIFAECGDGFLVTSAMGVHTANPISGDFSVGASGLWIEGGKPGRPVRGVTIAGNIKELLKSITTIGNDLRFFGSCGSPSILVSSLMVSGE